MSNDNQIDFTVRVKNEGLGALASDLDKVEEGAKGLGAAGTAAGAGVGKLGAAAGQAGSGLGTLAGGEGKAAAEAGALGASAKTAAQSVDTVGTSAGKAANELGAAAQKTDSFKGALTQVASAVAGVFAVGEVVDYARSVNDVADQYKNLEARVRLAVGAQGDLQATVAGVGQVAKDTYSNLDATAELFGRLAASGKELNITNAEALGITKTINQSIQVSGASAQASEASVRQLVQALQSGTLRGDEFNSIMEQAPRLAKALADGLGVPIGALRGMAEAGELTSARVVKALKGQADAINQEFSTLPLTTGRALENLNTQWTLFIGNLTGGAQQSSVVAQGINALAENLETLAGVAARAGTVLTAALAVQGVQALRSFAVEMAATGKSADLLALSLSKVPKVISITVAAVGFEVGYQIGTMLYENSELARKFGVGLVGYFEATVSGLQLLKETAAAIFTSDTLDAAFDRFEARNNVIRDSIALMWKDAEQAPSQIGAAADGAGAKVGALGSAATAAGQAAAGAGAAGAAGMAGIGKAADDARGALAALVGQLKTPVQINPFNDVLKGLQDAKKQGVDLEAFLREKLPAAIEKLSGPELMKFRNEFSVAMIEAKASGKALEAGLALIGVQAAKSLGVDAVAASSQLGAEFEASKKKLDVLIMTLPDLKAAGVDTAAVVGEAINKMIDGAKNQAELDALKLKIEQVRQVLGDKIADGLLDQAKEKATALKDALDAATPGINSVREAMAQLGITSDESLKKTAATAKEAYDTLTASGTASARELGEGFKKAAEAAITASNGVAPAWVTAGASMRGFEVEVDKAGKSTLRLKDATDQAAGAHGRAARATREQATELERLNAVREREIAAQEKANQLKEREIALYLKKWNMDSQHRSLDADGKVREETGMPTRKGVYDRAKNAGLSEEDAIALADSFDLNRLKDKGSQGTPFVNIQRLDDVINEAVLEAARRKARPTAPASAPAPPRSPAPTSSGGLSTGGAIGATYISNITLPSGRREKVAFADAASQSATEQLLRELATAKGVVQ